MDGTEDFLNLKKKKCQNKQTFLECEEEKYFQYLKGKASYFENGKTWDNYQIDGHKKFCFSNLHMGKVLHLGMQSKVKIDQVLSVWK